eukprot:CAMPEP_0204222746 /NCGR_PEP_ID=MMETSP0361-20130328/82414_1 /ASSEMBLY_ACC=CAM_ASM_000343 /TAXON_ID=268821 /ORGANISM="Scrippsiella Hangoei, Strain SHTV-5" /LENGTH=286 /DNA_ID=CAMNT_0051188403 /DNA_START=45 /DNA_END=903 /DNA_ORIENTATION=-
MSLFAGFTGCCCSDSQDRKDRNQLTFNYSTTDETAGGQVKVRDDGTRPVNGLAGAGLLPPAGQANSKLVVPGLPRVASSQSEASSRSLTAEQKEAEKARLQALVNSFAKRAVRGCPCEYVREGTGERLVTQYRIDKSLEYLIIVTPNEQQSHEVMCPIAAIQDIYSLIEDGEGCFPPEVVHVLKPVETPLLLMVVYRTGSDKLYRFCLMAESSESRDIFLECLRILCIYAQSAPSDPLDCALGAPPHESWTMGARAGVSPLVDMAFSMGQPWRHKDTGGSSREQHG